MSQPPLRTFVAAVLAFVCALASMPASADVCFSNNDCASGQFGGIRACSKSKVFGIELFFGTCARAGVCNFDGDCFAGARCLLGVCQAGGSGGSPGGSPGGSSSGSGTGISGEGRHCMPANGSKPADWATDKFGKPLGACPAGTRCSDQGICVRLET